MLHYLIVNLELKVVICITWKENNQFLKTIILICNGNSAMKKWKYGCIDINLYTCVNCSNNDTISDVIVIGGWQHQQY